MSITETTTGHSMIRERKFAGKLYLAILAAIIIAAFVSYSLSSRRNLNPANLGTTAGSISNDSSTAPAPPQDGAAAR